MSELIQAALLLILGLGAIYCAKTAWYLITPEGRLYWEKLQRRRAEQKEFRDWLNGKDKA